MNSLDPRVARLPLIGDEGKIIAKVPMDQFGTFEVFVQPKEGKPFQHEGVVHAPNLELGYILAKEAFTRRFTCTSLYVANTRDVFVSQFTEGNESVYDQISRVPVIDSPKKEYEIYYLLKRGKQHLHVGSVTACSAQEAMSEAKTNLNQGQVVYNIWAIETNKIRFTSKEEQELWLTLPEKKFRDAAEYKGGDRLIKFLEMANFKR